MDARLFLENSTVCQIVDAIWLACGCVLPLWGGVLMWWVLVEIGAVSSTSVEGGATIQPNLIGPYRDRFVCRLPCCFGGGVPCRHLRRV